MLARWATLSSFIVAVLAIPLQSTVVVTEFAAESTSTSQGAQQGTVVTTVAGPQSDTPTNKPQQDDPVTVTTTVVQPGPSTSQPQQDGPSIVTTTVTPPSGPTSQPQSNGPVVTTRVPHPGPVTNQPQNNGPSTITVTVDPSTIQSGPTTSQSSSGTDNATSSTSQSSSISSQGQQGGASTITVTQSSPQASQYNPSSSQSNPGESISKATRTQQLAQVTPSTHESHSVSVVTTLNARSLTNNSTEATSTIQGPSSLTDTDNAPSTSSPASSPSRLDNNSTTDATFEPLDCDHNGKDEGTVYVGGLRFFEDAECRKPLKAPNGKAGICGYASPPSQVDAWYGHHCNKEEPNAWPDLSGKNLTDRKFYARVDQPASAYQDLRMAVIADRTKCYPQTPGMFLSVLGASNSSCVLVPVSPSSDLGLTVWADHSGAEKRGTWPNKHEREWKKGSVKCKTFKTTGEKTDIKTVTYPLITPGKASLQCNNNDDCELEHVSGEREEWGVSVEYSIGGSGKGGASFGAKVEKSHKWSVESRDAWKGSIEPFQRAYLASTFDAELRFGQFSGCSGKLDPDDPELDEVAGEMMGYKLFPDNSSRTYHVVYTGDKPA